MLLNSNPHPFQWQPLPQAFIGELGCYYPARMREIRALTKRGLVERDSEGYEIDGVPVFTPQDNPDGTQVTPDQIENELRVLRLKQNGGAFEAPRR